MSAERFSLDIEAGFPGFTLRVAEALLLGGVTAVFGPSGGGKTTLLRAIAGFVRPRTGRIALGDDVWFDAAARIDVAAHRRPVGFLFQDARLFAHLSVSGNLDYAARRAAGEGPARAEIVAALGLEALLHRRVDALSGGERQRAALARTLLARPRLLLLDEPLAGLDRARKIEILPYLEAALTRFGVPALYVTHDVEEVARLAARVMILAGGKVEAIGPTADILERLDLQPITGRFEAGVLLEGCVGAVDPRLCLMRVDVGAAALSMPMIARLGVGERVRIRIRARDVALATKAPEGISIRNILGGHVDRIEIEPDTAFAEVFVALAGAHVRARITRAAVEELGLAPGAPVFALIKSVSFDRRLA